jgi:tetratricopeptide (TPR) repeat protein
MAAYRQALKLTEYVEERCGVLLGLASVMRLTDEYEAALELLDEAQAIGMAQGLTTELSKLHHLRGNLYFPLGRVDECLGEHEVALGYARQAGSTELEAHALGGIGDAEYARGRLLTAHKHFVECIRICQEQGYTRTEVANLNMIGGGGTYYYMNELPKALEASARGAEKGEQIGHERAALLAHFGISIVYFEMGDLARSEKHAYRMKELVERIGTKRFMARALHLEGRLRLAAGQRQEAVDLLREAMLISRETGVRYCGPAILGALARALQGSSQRNAIMEEAENLLAQGCVAHNYLEFYLDSMEVSYEEGEWDRLEHYASALENYTRVEPMPRINFLMERGRALASFGRGDRSQALSEDLVRLRNQAETVGLNWVLAALDNAIVTFRELPVGDQKLMR